MDFNKIIKDIKTNPTNTPWYKKKVSIIAMSSTLGVGVLTTAIAVPVALTSGSSTTPTIIPSEAITAFNNKTVVEKMNSYNSIMANAANNTSIKDYILKQGGMSHFFNENVEMPNSSTGFLDAYNAFKSFLTTYNSSNITASVPIFKPASGDNFLSIKAIADNNEANDNKPDINIYCSQQIESVFSGYYAYNFYSALKASITNITLNSDFSFSMTLSNVEKNNAFIIIRSNLTTVSFKYKSTITFNNATLYPGMSEYVKTSLLSLTA